jgi:hypothetical protein
VEQRLLDVVETRLSDAALADAPLADAPLGATLSTVPARTEETTA